MIKRFLPESYFRGIDEHIAKQKSVMFNGDGLIEIDDVWKHTEGWVSHHFRGLRHGGNETLASMSGLEKKLQDKLVAAADPDALRATKRMLYKDAARSNGGGRGSNDHGGQRQRDRDDGKRLRGGGDGAYGRGGDGAYGRGGNNGGGNGFGDGGGDGGDSGNRRCYVCWRTGHIALFCPTTNKSEHLNPPSNITQNLMHSIKVARYEWTNRLNSGQGGSGLVVYGGGGDRDGKGARGSGDDRAMVVYGGGSDRDGKGARGSGGDRGRGRGRRN